MQATDQRRARGRGRVAAALFAAGLLVAACSNSDAGKGDTRPQNNTDNPTQGSPGATIGGTQGGQSNGGGVGDGTGTGRGTETP